MILTLIKAFVLYDSLSSAINNDVECESTSRLLFDHYGEGFIGTSDFEKEPICCRAFDCCRNAAMSSAYLINCAANKACADTNLKTKGGLLYCVGSSSCFRSEITAEYDTSIYALGLFSLAKANIVSGPSSPPGYVHRSGYYPSISFHIQVYCGGSSACEQSSITINGGYQLSLYLLGQNSGTAAEITCNAGSICNIYCEGYGSCRHVQVSGNGLLLVKCDKMSGCPIGHTYDPTPSPTFQPTASPTFSPTVNTISPTLYPTNKPFVERQVEFGTSSGVMTSDVLTNTASDTRDSEDNIMSTIPILIVGAVFLLTFPFIFMYLCHVSRRNKRAHTKNIECMKNVVSTNREEQKIEKIEDEIIPGMDATNDQNSPNTETDFEQMDNIFANDVPADVEQNEITKGHETAHRNETSNVSVVEQMYNCYDHEQTPNGQKETTRGGETTTGDDGDDDITPGQIAGGDDV